MSDDLLELFLMEGRELVARASDDLAALETQPRDAGVLDSLFRALHTLKGSVALFDWPAFVQMLHAAEDVLGAVRAGSIAMDDACMDPLQACVSRTEVWLDALEANGVLPTNAAREAEPVTRALLETLAPGKMSAAEADMTDADAQEPLVAAMLDAAKQQGALPDAPLLMVTYTPDPDCYFRGDDPVAIARTVPGILAMKISPREPWGSLDAYEPFTCNVRIDLLTNTSASDVDAAFRLVRDQVVIRTVGPAATRSREPGREDENAGEGGRRMLRIDSARVDSLAHAVDEMIVAKNALSHLANEAERGVSGEVLARSIRDHQALVGKLAARMHMAATSMRLVSIGPAMRRLPRVVRDLAARLEKRVDVLLDVDEIEADKSIADGLSEPLLHVLRNAVDHGLEPASQRVAAGKPARAKIRISARRSGDRIVIAVEDDGRGIDPARIRAVALERAIMPAVKIDALSDREALDLVFAPGFSTAQEISDISGRGVGMDAVRSAIEAMGGRVEIESTPGLGTSVTLTLPLTIVLAQIAIVQVNDESFGIPMDDVVELARVSTRSLQTVRAGRAFVLRDRAIPLVSLASLLGRESPADGTNMRVLIVRAGGDLVGIFVDRLVDRIEAVVRPMRGLLAGMRGFAGTTLLSDGSVLMVLDLAELIE